MRRMASPPPTVQSVFSYDSYEDVGDETLNAAQAAPAEPAATAADAILTTVLVLLVLAIVACAVYQSRALIMPRVDRVVATSGWARHIRHRFFKWRSNAASDSEIDAFDDGEQNGSRMGCRDRGRVHVDPVDVLCELSVALQRRCAGGRVDAIHHNPHFLPSSRPLPAVRWAIHTP